MKRAGWICLATGALLFYVAILLTSRTGRTGGFIAPSSMAGSQVREVCQGIFIYTMAEARVRPYLPTLADYPEGNIPEEYLQYTDPKSKQVYDWLYYGNELTGRESGHSAILVAVPVLLDYGDQITHDAEHSRRVVGFADGHVEEMPEKDFQARLATQRAAGAEKAAAAADESTARTVE